MLSKPCSLLLVIALLLCAASVSAQSIRTIAGGGAFDGPASRTRFGRVAALATDRSGNLLVADAEEQRVRRIDLPLGQISTIAGNGALGFKGDGAAAALATLSFPSDVAVDSAGNLYIADVGNDRIRRIDAVSGAISTVVRLAAADTIVDMAIDRGDRLYFALIATRTLTCDIQRLELLTGRIESVRSDCHPLNPLEAPRLSDDLAIDSAGDLYVAVRGMIRRIDRNSGAITTIAGNGEPGSSGDGGLATQAQVSTALDMKFDDGGNLYLIEAASKRLRRINAQTNIIETVATLDDFPSAIQPSESGLYVADAKRVWRINPATGQRFPVAGGAHMPDPGPATSISLAEPLGIAVDGEGNVFVAEAANSPGRDRVKRVDVRTGLIETIAGDGQRLFRGDGGAARDASLEYPIDVAVDGEGNVYIVELLHRIRRVDAVTGIISTVAGTGIAGYSGDGGPAIAAQLNYPRGLAFDSKGNVYFGDRNNYRVRRIDIQTGVISTVAGNGNPLNDFSGDGGLATASAMRPVAVAFDRRDNLYIADPPRVRKVDALTGIITTVAGTNQPYCFGPASSNSCPAAPGDAGPATQAVLYDPTGIAVDAAGHLYIVNGSYTDCTPVYCWSGGDFRVRRVDAATGIITTVAGRPAAGVASAGGAEIGFSGDGGRATEATLNLPEDLALDSRGNLYLSDRGNRRVRVISTCAPLDAPEALQPADRMAGYVGGSPLIWRAAAPAFEYDLYLDTVSPPARPVGSGLRTMSFEVTGLAPSTTYYWRVVAKGDPNCPTVGEVASPIWSFTTAAARRRGAVSR